MRRILIGLALVLVALPAWAQTQQQIDWCYGTTATDDQTIAGCTAMIQSGRYTGSELSGILNNRGTGYYGKGQWDLAIQDANQSIQINSTDPVAFYNRGTAYDAKDLHDQAIADFSQAIALKPDYVKPYNNRALSYYEKGDAARGLLDANKAISIEPRANRYFVRAEIYEKLGQRANAIADYRSSLGMDPTYRASADALKRLGVTP